MRMGRERREEWGAGRGDRRAIKKRVNAKQGFRAFDAARLLAVVTPSAFNTHVGLIDAPMPRALEQ